MTLKNIVPDIILSVKQLTEDGYEFQMNQKEVYFGIKYVNSWFRHISKVLDTPLNPGLNTKNKLLNSIVRSRKLTL